MTHHEAIPTRRIPPISLDFHLETELLSLTFPTTFRLIYCSLLSLPAQVSSYSPTSLTRPLMMLIGMH
jgi:hypothetical protein